MAEDSLNLDDDDDTAILNGDGARRCSNALRARGGRGSFGYRLAVCVGDLSAAKRLVKSSMEGLDDDENEDDEAVDEKVEDNDDGGRKGEASRITISLSSSSSSVRSMTMAFSFFFFVCCCGCCICIR